MIERRKIIDFGQHVVMVSEKKTNRNRKRINLRESNNLESKHREMKNETVRYYLNLVNELLDISMFLFHLEIHNMADYVDESIECARVIAFTHKHVQSQFWTLHTDYQLNELFCGRFFFLSFSVLFLFPPFLCCFAHVHELHGNCLLREFIRIWNVRWFGRKRKQIIQQL